MLPNCPFKSVSAWNGTDSGYRQVTYFIWKKTNLQNIVNIEEKKPFLKYCTYNEPNEKKGSKILNVCNRVNLKMQSV